MLKIITVLGARPQFVKADFVSRAFAKSSKIDEIIVHTGQHFDINMSDIFFEELKIPKPSYNLNINGLAHGAMTGQMLERIEEILLIEKPDWVFVYGDTNSTIAGALAAKKLHIKVAHVEAGLRSHNIRMPEEINRILTDRMSDILFCPTNKAVENLKKEGYENMSCKIVLCGDVMNDAALFYRNKAKKPNINLPKNYILCTVHRAENTDDPIRLKSIFDALQNISNKCKVVIPLHPRTKAKLDLIDFNISDSNIDFISPVSYLEMIYLLKNCRMVMTDSGGLQKEAYFFKKHCITMRDETEWVELVDCGYNYLTGSDTNIILNIYNKLLLQNSDHFSTNLYGNGNAGEIITEQILRYECQS